MDIIKVIIPMLGVILGFTLSEFGKFWSVKREDKRKIKRLIYYLLELRFHFVKEFTVENSITEYLKMSKEKIVTEFGNEANFNIDELKPYLVEIIKSSFGEENQIKYLEQNIDKVIIEIAEIYPILAYELTGQHKIKDRLHKAENYLNEVDHLINELPFDMKDWIKPQLTKELLSDLSSTINKLGTKIGYFTKKEIKEKISNQDSTDNTSMNEFLDEYIEKIKVANNV